MSETAGSKVYDLEERTFRFAKRARRFIKRLPPSVANLEDSRQLVRSSGSVGANYIEANESLGKKDFRLHVRIARKEAKESRYWLRLVDPADGDAETESLRQELIRESTELMLILAAILRKSG
ncbi:MAG TPA: four helix bundle protein [Gemmataceae bacterium]